jgi:hypothetical protein
MDREIRETLRQLRQVNKNYQQWLRGAATEADVDRSVAGAMAQLKRKPVASQVKALMERHQPEWQEPDKMTRVIREAKPMMVASEARIARDLRVRHRDLLRAMTHLEREPEVAKQAKPDVKGLEKELDRLLKTAKEEGIKARALPRREKKERKRDLAKGIWSAVFGVGIIVADTQLPPLAAASYGVGLAALNQAGRDIVGEEEL